MTHVRERSATKLIPTAKHGVRVARVIGPIERWTEPQAPVESLRNRRSVRGQCGELRPHWAVRPIVNLAQRPDGAGVDPSLDRPDSSAIAGRQEMGGDAS